MQYKVVKSPSEQLSLTNCVIVNKNDFNPDLVKFMKKIFYVKRQHKMPHLQVQVPKTLLETFLCTLKIFGVKLGMTIQRQFIEITWESKKFIFGIKAGGVNTQEIGFSFIQRKWTTVVLQSTVEAKPHLFDKTKTLVESMILDVDFLQKAKSTQEAYDTDKMATDFTVSFQSLPFTIGQPVVFNIEGKPYLVLTVKDLAVADPTAALGTKSKADTTSKKRVNCGILMSNTHITFEKAEESKVVLKGKARGRSSMPSIINPDWDFTDMGIGGLDKEFSAIFRRAFASRVFPPEVVEQFGLKHVKGILLFGPPGCGKTLMARQIGTMLNAREPKIVNGPEILNKYVGESEANIRNLFSDAITEQKQAGLDSGLHMIIFDEIDAICKQRGSMSGSTGVHDTVVNQLLSMIDGVEQLNNILVIGMTNRKDLIDEALLRPGRLEVQMEIGLPSQEGRLQILNIHTAKLRNEKKLSEDVSLEVLSVETKNFSGAEIEGLVRAAATTSMNKLVKVEGKVSIDPDAIENLKISREDFELALANDIKPSFGADTEDFENYVANGIVMWGTPVQKVFEDCKLLLNQTRHGELISPVSVLLEGCQGGGKTALAANLAQISDFPFIKICSPQKMVGYSETAKCQAIKKVFDDAYKSELSCVVVDDIERLIDYVPIGPRFSNLVLQALMVLLKRSLPKGRKLLIIGTTSCRDVLEQMQLLQVFNTVVHVPSITKPDQLMEVVKKLNYFDEAELEFIKSGIAEMNINIGIKKLLSLVEMAIQTDIGMRAEKFQVLLQEQSW